MHPRVSKDEQYFANLNGKRPPVPGKEDDYELQCSSQESNKYPHLDRHPQQAQANMYFPFKSSKLTKDNSGRVSQDLQVSRFQNSNVKNFDSNKVGGKVESVAAPTIRENGVGETSDETSKVIDRERSHPASASGKAAPLDSGRSRERPRCCADDDEVVCFESYATPKSNSPTTCLRWTEGLNSLLTDAEGLDLFRRFLQNESSESSKVLDFVFSCRGLQLMNEAKREKLVEVARLIHKRYILKEAGARLDPETKRSVADRMRKAKDASSDQSGASIKGIFVEALTEAEKYLEKEIYPMFLKSDDFLNYFQRETELMFNNNNNNSIQADKNCNSTLGDGRDPVKKTAEEPSDPGSSFHTQDDDSYNNCEEGEADLPGGGGGRGGRKPPPSPKLEELHPAAYGSVLPSLPEEKELELTYQPKFLPSSVDHHPTPSSSAAAVVAGAGGCPGGRTCTSVSVLQLSSLSLLATRKTRQKHVELNSHNHHLLPSSHVCPPASAAAPVAAAVAAAASLTTRPSNPYHVSYAPGSAQDSELQSLSSDAQTEDTLSFTDSSLDGRHDAHASSRCFSLAAYKKHIRYVRNFAAKNHEANFPGRFIPRTDCAPPDCNLATTNPQAFASMLIGKLQVVKENQEKMERLVKIMQGLQNTENANSIKDPSVLHNHHHHHHHYHHHQPQKSGHGKKSKQGQGHHAGKHGASSLPSDDLSLCAPGEADDPDNAQSILDDHVSQLWNSFGNSPNQFNSGLVTPEAAKLKADVCDSFHCACCSSKACDNLESFGRHCREGTTDFQISGHHRRISSDMAPSGGTLASHPVSTKGQQHCTLIGHHAPPAQRNRNTSRNAGTSCCHPPPRDTNYQLPYGTNSGDQIQNGPADLSYGRHSSASCEAVVVVGQAPNRHPLFSPEGKDRSYVSRCGHDRLANKIQSNNSAFNRHTQSRKQQIHGNIHDIPDSAVPAKSRQSEKKIDLAKGAAEISSHHSKMHPTMFKVSPFSPNNQEAQNAKGPRSKSLDGHKILSIGGNSCFSHAVQDSAFLECKPSANKADGHRRAMKENVEATKHGQISSRPHPGNSKGSTQSSTTAEKEKSNLPQSTKKQEAHKESTVVGYYMQNELIPYRITLPGREITLGQLKVAISKKDNFRFFFKKSCSDFDTDVVHEEVSSDDHVLPLWDGKVVCRIERVD